MKQMPGAHFQMAAEPSTGSGRTVNWEAVRGEPVEPPLWFEEFQDVAPVGV